MTYTYRTTGTCAREIFLDISEDGVIRDVRFTNGCDGNTQGLRALVRGRKAREVQQLLQGIRCENKPTSCPDQLARALGEVLEKGEITEDA
jgi:uncharacterized protein (TIGR03905 family)